MTCLGKFKHSTGDALRPKFNALGCPLEQIGDLAWACDMCRCTCQSKGHTKAKKKLKKTANHSKLMQVI